MEIIMLVMGVGTLIWNIIATIHNGKEGFGGATLLGILLILWGIFTLVF
jgi:hypothetical protein